MSGTEHAERFRLEKDDDEDDPAALLPAVVVG